MEDNTSQKGIFKKVKTSTTFITLFISLIIGICLRIFVFEVVEVSGVSMFPTFRSEQFLGILKVFGDIEGEDTIVFNQDNYYYIKRVIATPGDHLVIKDNKVFVNDELLEENYLSEEIKTTGEIDLIIPNEQYFVMGDNREQSKDSRSIGTIDKKDILGKVLIEFF